MTTSTLLLLIATILFAVAAIKDRSIVAAGLAFLAGSMLAGVL